MWSWLKLRSYWHRNTPCCALCAVFVEQQEPNPTNNFRANQGVSRGRLCRVKICTALIKEYGDKKVQTFILKSIDTNVRMCYTEHTFE